MYNPSTLVVIALLMMLVTVGPRVAPVALDYHRTPRWLSDILSYSPACLIGALVASPVLSGSATSSLSMPALVGVAASAVAAYLTNSLAITVVLGVAAQTVSSGLMMGG